MSMCETIDGNAADIYEGGRILAPIERAQEICRPPFIHSKKLRPLLIGVGPGVRVSSGMNHEVGNRQFRFGVRQVAPHSTRAASSHSR
jgi:hypothetical protein